MRVLVPTLMTVMLVALATAISGGILQAFWNAEPLGKTGAVIGAVGGYTFGGCFLVALLWALWQQPKAPPGTSHLPEVPIHE